MTPFFLVFLLAISWPAWAADKFAHPAGGGTTCSSNSPCSLAGALSAAQPGDDVVLQDGNYTGNWDTVRSGTAGNMITIRAQNKWQANIRATGAGTHLLDVRHSYIKVRYLHFDGVNNSFNEQNAVRVRGQGSITQGNIVEHNFFEDCNVTCIHIQDTNGTIFRFNRVDGSGFFSDETFAGEVTYMSQAGGGLPATNIEIYGNEIVDANGECFDLKEDTNSVEIHHNICTSVQKDSASDPRIVTGLLSSQGASNVNVRDNIFRNYNTTPPNGTGVFAIYQTSANVTIENNVAYNGTHGNVTQGNSGPLTNINIRNNTFCNLNNYNTHGVIDSNGVNFSNNNGYHPGSGVSQSNCDAEVARILAERDDLPGSEISASGYYVAATGGGGTSCTNLSPCTFSQGQTQAQNGETIILKNGTYPWFHTTKAGITYQAQTKHLAIISNSGNHAGGNQAIGISHNNTTIDGLRVTGNQTGGGSGHGLVRALTGISGFVLRNSIVELAADALVNICGTHNSNCSNILIEDNILRNSGYNASFAEGIYVGQFQGNNIVDGVIIRRNIIQGVGCDQQIDVKAGGRNVEVYYNILELQDLRAGGGCAFPEQRQVFVSQGEIDFHHNIIRNNNKTSSPKPNWLFNTTLKGGKVQHNVAYNNDFLGDLIRIKPTASNLGSVDTEISNNVFCQNSGTQIESGFNSHDNIFRTGAHADCTAKEAEILALIGGEEPQNVLLAHWTFNGTLTSAVGGPTLTYGGGGNPVYVEGIVGQAISFDGSHYATTGTHSIAGTELFPTTGNPFSVAMFFKTSQASNAGTLIASAVSTEANRDLQIFIQNETLDTFLRGTRNNSFIPYNDDEWHHVAITWSGMAAWLYIDGVFIGQMTVGADSEDTGEHIIIGARTGGTGFPFTGLIDDVRIYNYVISASTIANLAAPLVGGQQDIVSGLVAHWTFNDTLINSAPMGGPNLVHSGTPVYVTGQIGNAISLNGLNWLTAGVHQIGDTRLFAELGNEWSVSIWFQTAATGTAIASAVDAVSERDFQIALSGAMDLYMRGVLTRSAVTTHNNNAWHHTVVTWDGSIAKWYYDNVLISANVAVGTSIEDVSEPIILGARTGGAGFRLTGSLDDARIYNRAITAGQVGALFVLIPDTENPEPPTSIQITVVSSTRLDLSWTPGTDNSGAIVSTHISRCQGGGCSTFSPVDTTSGTSYSDSGLLPGTLYRYVMISEDSSGNLSTFSSIVEATTLADVSGVGSLRLGIIHGGSVQ